VRIAIFGATGRTGRLLVERAVKAGHEVTAVARRPEAVENPGDRMHVVRADITDFSAVAAAVTGQLAILSALGSPTWRPNTILSQGIDNIVTAMQSRGVTRFVCMSSLGVGETRGQLGPVYNLFLIPVMLRHIFIEKERLESRIRKTDLDWTIVRPAALTDKPARLFYRAELPPARPPRLPHISRADVADFMVAEITRPRFLRQAVGLWDR
jgi:putative NADH-flavin reductase